MNTSNNLLAHRGFTHSFLIVAIVAVFFAVIAERGIDRIIINLKMASIFGGVIFIHVFIECIQKLWSRMFEPYSPSKNFFQYNLCR
jgi:inner membrane protein